jgi:2-haloacid dehalogenase
MVGEADRLAERVKALIFDTGGTVFDWHSGVAASLSRIGSEFGIQADWPALTKEWRRTSTDMVKKGLPADGGRSTIDMDGVLRLTLDQMLAARGLDHMAEEGRRRLVHAWHDLDAWPDVGQALPRLRRKFIISPFTILNTRLVIDASRRSNLSWDCVISCEMIGIYKTLPGSYETAARWLGLSHDEILLVTTHNNDLKAAHENGFPTAFVYRPDEWGDIPSLDPEPDPVTDMVCWDFNDLADQLACARA